MTDRIQAQMEQMWDLHEFETAMIAAYVPEAEQMSRDEALALAYQRDREAAEALRISAGEL